MKRYLVTGGCGFIGSNFIRHFLNEHQDVSVVNLDKLTYAGLRSNTQEFEGNPQYQFIHGDICDIPLVMKLMREIEAVIHFAAETHVDRSIESGHDFITTNVLGTNVLLEAAHREGVRRFLHFSTDEVYGSCRDGSFREDSPLNPTSPYAASKAAGDLVALAYVKTHQVPVLIIRATNNFGPYQFPEKVIPLFMTNLIEGKKVPLYAKGENMRDWLFVEDCAEAVDFLLTHGKPGEIYNLAGGSEMSNLELTRRILREFGKSEKDIQYAADRAAHDFRYSLDMGKLSRLGFKISARFNERLKETADWYRQHEPWWKPLKADAYTLK